MSFPSGLVVDAPALAGAISGIRVRASDAFTGTDASTLEAHVANDGGTWTKSVGSGAGSDTIDANRVHNTNDATIHVYRHSWAPVSPNYRVSVDVILLTDNDLSEVGPSARIDPAAHTNYTFRYRSDANIWTMLKTVAGTGTTLGGNVGATLTPSRPYRVEIDVNGSVITGFVDGVALITVVDTAITAAGLAGIRTGGAAAAGVGVHLDNFMVRQ